MGSLFERITDWIKEGLIDAITGQYTSIFNSVNNQVADVANQVGQTPQGWNGGVFSMIQNLCFPNPLSAHYLLHPGLMRSLGKVIS